MEDMKQEETTPTHDKLQDPRIYVGNMPYLATKHDVEMLFEDAGLLISSIDISIDPFTQLNPSYCFVDCVSTEAATSAMQTLNGKNFLGRPLKIRPSTKKRATEHRPQSDRLISSRWDSTPSQSLPATQTNPDTFVAKTPGPLHQTRRLYVGGLPRPGNQHTSDVELRRLFKDFDVEAVSKVKSPPKLTNGKARNHHYVFVDLSRSENAEAVAKEMDGKVAFGCRLKVALAKRGPTVEIAGRE